MQKLDAFKAILSVAVVAAVLILFEPRYCKDDPPPPPVGPNIDSIKAANVLLFERIAQKNHEIGLLYYKVDSLAALKSKIIYKTKTEVVMIYHDSCKKYYNNCVNDLAICEQIGVAKDSIAAAQVVSIDLLTAANNMYIGYLGDCGDRAAAIELDLQRWQAKAKRRGKVIGYMAAVLGGTVAAVYLAK